MRNILKKFLKKSTMDSRKSGVSIHNERTNYVSYLVEVYLALGKRM